MILSRWAVTLKLPRNPEHDPANKITGPCPMAPDMTCTDTTGQHHTILVFARDEAHAGALAVQRTGVQHVTRVEQV